MALIPYNKPHATGAQRVTHLRARGLIIPKPTIAARKIDLVGYERLRIYFLSRRQLNLVNHPFRPGTQYQEILRLYACDIKLRDACFAAVGQFELLLRNAISEALSASFGSHPYNNIAAFQSPASALEAIQTFTKTYELSKDPRAGHYKITYCPPLLPPIWTMKEFLTFGKTVRLFNCLNNTLKQRIATQFGVPAHQVFSSWISCLVDLRNICAHHDRLFNRSFQKQPATLTKVGLPVAPRHKLKAILECLDYLSDQRKAPVKITAKVGSIIRKFPEVAPAEVGF
ncbi:Abi family protein [Acetobacter sp. TBRC 12305]|uniref:Abi family protein n=1 Tax=Acetobacter garciniae TaxID=2817435 RepID=A0A939HQ78_9PROT|nr:Abi family protein [Acetobacter garciniae]MBO1326294.1 Abi family protein [Acetobacter garciniae]MBX0345967.1 Abi family protein [Acetobacter garciniae]